MEIDVHLKHYFDKVEKKLQESKGQGFKGFTYRLLTYHEHHRVIRDMRALARILDREEED